MFRIPLPFTDWSLVLSPRWSDLDPAWQVAVMALVALVPGALLLWLYRYELRLVRRRTAVLLLGLRLVMIALLWFLITLTPELKGPTRTKELSGRVVLAIDQSGSMSVPDPQRTRLEKLRLVRTLKLRAEGGLPTPDQLNAWIAHYEKADKAKAEPGEPAWVAPGEADGDPAHRKQLADERRAAHDQLCAAVDRLTRADVVRRLLAADGAGLLARFKGKHEVTVIGFDGTARTIEPEHLDEALKARSGDSPEAASTDLGAPLLHAEQSLGTGEGRVLGVVLLTDGQHNASPPESRYGRTPSPEERAGQLAKLGAPVFAVAVGPRKSPPDIALLGVTAPVNVLQGVDAAVEARFKVSGLPAQELIVELHRGKEPPSEEHTRRVKHDGTDRVYSVPFRMRMDRVGTQALAVTVRPTVEGTKEVNDKNNRWETVVRVTDDRPRVLVIDGEARWELHYLINALRRDPGVRREAVVFVQPRVGQIPEAELEKIGNPRLALPRPGEDKDGGDPLLKYDCIVLGDVSPDHLTAEDRRRLEKYVADRGGTLVLLAGKRYLPLSFRGEAAEGEDDPLLKMLPVERPRAVSPLKGFPVTLTYAGGLTSFLRMEDAPEDNARRWAELPRHYWGLVGRPKPGAVALAYVAEDLRPPEDVERDKKEKDNLEKSQALIVRQNYGFGRVLLVGLESTWRWRYKVGDELHHRFWGQLVRWAASDKLPPAGNRFVRFGSRKPVYAHGKEVTVVARLEDEVPPLPAGAVALARVLRRAADGKEELAAPVELRRSERQPRLLEGTVRNLPPGQYRVELDIPELADKLKEPPEGGPPKEGEPRRDLFRVLPGEGGEMVDLATNWSLLQALTHKGRGKVVAPEEADRLVELLRQRVETTELRNEQKVWEDPPVVWVTLGLFLLLLTVEWVGRKLAGLP
jgi:hypothetical protein